MSYIDVYFSRVNHLGESVGEIAKNAGTRSFERWMNESPNCVKGLSVERGLFFDGIILTNKDKEQSKIMYLNVACDVPLVVGDIVNWDAEKWIIFSKERKVRETHQTFLIIRCNYLIKWIDKAGHLQQSWSYLVSSMDGKIKENFRTWNSLITPQPNKYLEAIVPKCEIDKLTRFIIEEEGWYVVEYDRTSVPGIMYVSFTEEKVNSLTDDTDEDIADLDKLAKYLIILPEGSQCFFAGDEVVPFYSITKNGDPVQMDVEITPKDKKIVNYVNGKLMAIKEGTTTIEIRLKEFPDVVAEETVRVGVKPTFAAYLEGKATIRLDRTAVYELKANEAIVGSVEYRLEGRDDLATIEKVENNCCTVRANKNNKLGSVVLIATYKGAEYTKDIKIIPIW